MVSVHEAPHARKGESRRSRGKVHSADIRVLIGPTTAVSRGSSYGAHYVGSTYFQVACGLRALYVVSERDQRISQ